MYVRMNTQQYPRVLVHKYIDTSDNRGRLNPEGHVPVQALVMTKMFYHTCQLSQRRRAGNQNRHPSRVNQVTITSVHGT